MWQQHGTMKNSSFPVGRVKNAHGTYSEVGTEAYAIHKAAGVETGERCLIGYLIRGSEPQSSTTYRSFVQRYRECERNAGVSRCECSAKNPDSDYPTSTRKPAPDARRCTAGARPRLARGWSGSAAPPWLCSVHAARR
jgi:hypothetical protein